MKSFIFIILVFPTLVFADFVQLSHGQKVKYARRNILCSQTKSVENNCFAHPLKGKRMGIVLPNKKVISVNKGWRFLGKLQELYSNNTCDNFYSFSLSTNNHMPSGSVLKFKDRSYRCPAASEFTMKTCRLVSTDNGFEIYTPGGITFKAGKLQATQLKLKKLAQMNICNDVEEI